MGMKPLLLTVSSLSKGTVPLISLSTVRWNGRGEAVRKLPYGRDTLDVPAAPSHVFYPILIGIAVILDR